MARTARHTPRQQFDFYETPPHYLDALFDHLELPDHSRVVEPCSGDGAISDLLTAEGHQVITNDLDRKRGAKFHHDAAGDLLWDLINADWTITNPPFSDIEGILTHSLMTVENTISLARLSILEPTVTRKTIFRMFGDPDLLIVLPRYKFSDPSKDTMTCCWIGWGPQVPHVFTIYKD